MMNFENAFNKILFAGYDIEAVCNCDYLWEIEGISGTMTAEEVINFAETI